MINKDVSPVKYFSGAGERERVFNDFGEEIFFAGHMVEPGCYVEVDGDRQVVLDQRGVLPASLDGRRVVYRRLERPWVMFSQTQANPSHN
jgi:hypothetical protein